MHACRLLFIQSTGEVNTGDVDFFLSGKAIARPGVSLEETNQVDLVLEKCGWGGGNNLKISTGVLKSQNDRLGVSPTKTPTWRM